MNPLIKKISRSQTIEEKVYDHLKQMILTGELKPGIDLTETSIASDLGVSRTPIRSALSRLTNEGLISSSVNKGYQVKAISPAELTEIYQIRELLECQIIREVATRFTTKELEDLDSDLDEADTSISEGDIRKFMKHSRKFHHAFDEKYGNTRLTNLLHTYDERVNQLTSYLFKIDRLNIYKLGGINDHREIVKAVRNGNIELASQVMKKHLRYVLEELLKQIPEI